MLSQYWFESNHASMGHIGTYYRPVRASYLQSQPGGKLICSICSDIFTRTVTGVPWWEPTFWRFRFTTTCTSFFQNRNHHRHYLSLLRDDTGLPYFILVFGVGNVEVEWVDVTMSDCSYVLRRKLSGK